jgi:hypothetical protein
MIKFIKLPTEYDKRKIEIETDSCTLSELLEDFESFLRACGYSLNGTLDIAPEDQDLDSE